MKLQQLPKANKGVQTKILSHPTAVSFLETAGFSFTSSDNIQLTQYNAVIFGEATDAINIHVSEMGGQVKVENAFDATKQFKVSTTGDKFTKPPSSKDIEDKYDPTKT
mmetsp:Transcript_16807/g.25888  ORF Transcript_16807/g.25888 Transcript_16807/m.25888 type:complete len:108 (+) Transcript_16807:515-838(+)